MNTEETNKLISEFMGLELTAAGWYSSETNSFVGVYGNRDTGLPYDKSWDWLMPVVAECFNRYEGFDNECVFNADNQQFKLNDALLEINIDSLYKAVVKFIQWYNEQQD